MKKKIFYRFFAVTLVAVLLMFASGIVAVNLNTKNVVNERLKEETGLAATLMNEASDFSLFNRYKNNPELRITVFDLDGNVLYESDTTAALENHANREEIIEYLVTTRQGYEKARLQNNPVNFSTNPMLNLIRLWDFELLADYIKNINTMLSKI